MTFMGGIERAAHNADPLPGKDERCLDTQRAEIAERNFSHQGLLPHDVCMMQAAIKRAGSGQSHELCI